MYGLCLWNIEDDIYLLCVEAHRLDDNDAHLQSSGTTVMSTMSTYGLCLWNIEDDIYLLRVEAHTRQ